MDAETLFVNVYEDLESKSSMSEYDALRASSLLRQLLLDSTPLVNVVNRGPRLSITFHVTRAQAPPGPGVERSAQCNLLALPPMPSDQILNLRAFLKHEDIYIAGHPISIREAIRFSAHVMGGVHLGRAAGVPETVMHDWYESAPPDAANIPTMFISNIAQVVLRDLKPLYTAIKPIAPGQKSRTGV